MTGILPTLTEQQLNLNNMSRRMRYYALNQEVLKRRNGKQYLRQNEKMVIFTHFITRNLLIYMNRKLRFLTQIKTGEGIN